VYRSAWLIFNACRVRAMRAGLRGCISCVFVEKFWYPLRFAVKFRGVIFVSRQQKSVP
jgi:hypothetical protein